MQNSCMNFVVYWCIFQHIKMLLDVIIMFCIDLWGFSIDPPYFGYNSAEPENHVLRIFYRSPLFWLWAAQHDYGTYYVIPMWWILILLDDLWNMICYYVLDVWVDAYCYPVLYYLFWSNLYARAREEDGVY
jgi:hypothetical protein